MNGVMASVEMGDKCSECGTAPVAVKKWELCIRCYHRLRKTSIDTSVRMEKISKSISPSVVAKYEHLSELEFIKNFFTHTQWIAQPCNFMLPSGEKYRPDFYDAKENVFIEVAGTRQAFYANRHKYREFVETFPLLNFEIRKSSGELMSLEEKQSWAVKA